eukprot:1157348-Pelagomonas_calceolata.AAC.3
MLQMTKKFVSNEPPAICSSRLGRLMLKHADLLQNFTWKALVCALVLVFCTCTWPKLEQQEKLTTDGLKLTSDVLLPNSFKPNDRAVLQVHDGNTSAAYEVHKASLALASPVFNDIFKNDPKRKIFQGREKENPMRPIINNQSASRQLQFLDKLVLFWPKDPLVQGTVMAWEWLLQHYIYPSPLSAVQALTPDEVLQILPVAHKFKFQPALIDCLSAAAGFQYKVQSSDPGIADPIPFLRLSEHLQVRHIRKRNGTQFMP